MIIDFVSVYLKLIRGEVRIIEISIVICDRDAVMMYWSRSRFERYPLVDKTLWSYYYRQSNEKRVTYSLVTVETTDWC